jgi:hypothetical protein
MTRVARPIEYAVDVWDLTGTEPKPDSVALLRHLNDFGAEGWELAWMAFNIDIVGHGECHLLVFKRLAPDGVANR